MHIVSSNPKWFVIVKDGKYFTHHPIARSTNLCDNYELANTYIVREDAEAIARQIKAEIKPIY